MFQRIRWSMNDDVGCQGTPHIDAGIDSLTATGGAGYQGANKELEFGDILCHPPLSAGIGWIRGITPV